MLPILTVAVSVPVPDVRWCGVRTTVGFPTKNRHRRHAGGEESSPPEGPPQAARRDRWHDRPPEQRRRPPDAGRSDVRTDAHAQNSRLREDFMPSMVARVRYRKRTG
ncbi:hypothetical protein GCM10007368_09130 [Isoptericola cucumis]|uniref:Uncharacterized protein n=1 Tax=Isoptericola cucumis TaxID=1776856 RepID=A0ABQ2B249_9MICO|nr:hypothetical protein GCM10007368_09130 [Isoptericola cucumis]